MGIIASTNLGARQPVPEGMTSGMASQGSRGVPGALWNERMTDIDIVGRQMAENERVLRKEIDLLKQRVLWGVRLGLPHSNGGIGRAVDVVVATLTQQILRQVYRRHWEKIDTPPLSGGFFFSHRRSV